MLGEIVLTQMTPHNMSFYLWFDVLPEGAAIELQK